MKVHNLLICAALSFLLLACISPANQSGIVLRDLSTDVSLQLVSTKNMLVARAAHTSTQLPNGKILITGGFHRGEDSLASAEIFDGTTNTFSFTGEMNSARQSHSATLLQNGKVLIAGGYGPSGEYLRSAELYDPQIGMFTPIANMTVARAGQTATLLTDGTVLLVGGVTTGWRFLESAELYDPSQNRFVSTGNMHVERESHTATLLKDGSVLITGGHRGRRSAITIYATAEKYDPLHGEFTIVSEMHIKRHKHDAVLLPDGQVLVLGGTDERDGQGAYQSAEIYDPKLDLFRRIADMGSSRYKFQGTSIVLQNGTVLLLGGASAVESYHPDTERFETVLANGVATRLFAATSILPDGRILLSGGYDSTTSASSSVWLFQS